MFLWGIIMIKYSTRGLNSDWIGFQDEGFTRPRVSDITQLGELVSEDSSLLSWKAGFSQLECVIVSRRSLRLKNRRSPVQWNLQTSSAESQREAELLGSSPIQIHQSGSLGIVLSAHSASPRLLSSSSGPVNKSSWRASVPCYFLAQVSPTALFILV